MRAPDEKRPAPSEAGAGSPRARPDSLILVQPHWHSEQLFGEHHEICIQHGTSLYRLRKTSLGKLILTK
jgi:hemin uptake protein HemP